MLIKILYWLLAIGFTIWVLWGNKLYNIIPLDSVWVVLSGIGILGIFVFIALKIKIID